MLSQKLFDEISNKISETIAASPAKDIEKNIKAMMGATFARMDLVTREEFDVQQEVLARTREQLTQLEARLQALEAAAVVETGAPAADAPAADIEAQ
ncbi:accessory factor UbiK family protein [Vogesella indigofera]|uniref:accessory factor UbiK family protein n=1 Tax=Vogesella indigofera TaxID=45465 RepID=UPI00234EE7F7|nr:accessory factor UbiK family protein [Vogesella indigofera]MDC7700835.1 accessory factor UbiK family protein [Vogesella indigofera]